jgi:hypothetical protein
MKGDVETAASAGASAAGLSQAAHEAAAIDRQRQGGRFERGSAAGEVQDPAARWLPESY